MRIILWVVRFLAILLLIRVVLRMLFSPRRPQPSQGAASRHDAGHERIGGELVRDPNCGTYIPKARALAVGSGDTTLYFCSDQCREAYAKKAS